MTRGKFVVIDGIDGVGKGVFLDALIEEAEKEGKGMFDVHESWKKQEVHPDPKGIIRENFHLVITSEPTFVGLGKYLREELIAKNQRNYSPEAVAEAYALDRRILYEQLTLPLLEAGIDIYQSRSFASSIVYQRQSALDEGRDFKMEEILAIPGNAFCYAHPMDYLIVPIIEDVQEAIRRSQQREKKDHCKFENLEFQLKLKVHYESEEFRAVFSKIKVPLIYMDAGVSIEHSRQQAREFYHQHLRIGAGK